VPLALLPLALAAIAFLVLPLAGLVQRAPWSDLGSVLRDPEVGQALQLSLWTSTLSTLLCLVLGVPLAWLLARSPFPGRSLVRALVTLPMVLPPVVGGAALLYSLGRRSPIGSWLEDALGVRLAFSTPGVVLAQSFVALPFLVITVQGALEAGDRGLEEAATTLGAGRWTVLRRVTLPRIAPSLAAGAVLAWARALGEFGATITFNGSFPGRTQTMPLAVYQALNRDPGAAVVLSLLLVAVSLAVLVTLRGRWTTQL
jgi:molybdate transport system permease protein